MHVGDATCKTVQALSLVFNDGKVLMFKKKPLAEDNGYPTRHRFSHLGLFCTKTGPGQSNFATHLMSCVRHESKTRLVVCAEKAGEKSHDDVTLNHFRTRQG